MILTFFAQFTYSFILQCLRTKNILTHINFMILRHFTQLLPRKVLMTNCSQRYLNSKILIFTAINRPKTNNCFIVLRIIRCFNEHLVNSITRALNVSQLLLYYVFLKHVNKTQTRNCGVILGFILFIF